MLLFKTFSIFVVPAKAGIQLVFFFKDKSPELKTQLGPCFRRGDIERTRLL
jgi:hypothetical protein